MQNRKETITPAKAEEMLKRNSFNRPLDPQAVSKYATSMASGEWVLNGDPIRFDVNDELADGQHRLAACIESGVPFNTYVCRGLPSEAFDTIDQGRRRTLDHILARRKEDHPSVLAGAIRCVWRYANGFVSCRGELRPSAMDSVLERHPKLRESVAYYMGCRSAARRRVAPNAIGAGFHYLFGLANQARSDSFWKRVLIGEELLVTMPEYTLRQRMLDNHSAHGAKLTPDMIAALTIKAWNAVSRKTRIGCLRWSCEEQFPNIFGTNHIEL